MHIIECIFIVKPLPLKSTIDAGECSGAQRKASNSSQNELPAAHKPKPIAKKPPQRKCDGCEKRLKPHPQKLVFVFSTSARKRGDARGAISFQWVRKS
jgi:hypothetical protein